MVGPLYLRDDVEAKIWAAEQFRLIHGVDPVTMERA